jgi:signal transduction histidine kinase
MRRERFRGRKSVQLFEETKPRARIGRDVHDPHLLPG